ncbi:hypothetical protein SAMN05444266_106412 [Chitinophaga jiangningensis]|uniref:Lipoprotein n=1 Tax=Chitinophaga jiangningensis TaxID=1419482 RepID=A0A1M7G5X1_9BACT|nr:hypothetical protein [Chitinophaga jiangningensis]SHM11586.1 hypothetical protein SAMN05444266_106412 [Chitinophaga jiangningensis]
MQTFRMRYFLLSSAVLAMLVSGCRSVYKGLQTDPAASAECVKQFAPAFTNSLYSAQADVTKHHLSGLVLLKQMPDSSVRLVFANEMGFKFFDFEYDKDGNFTKHFIIPKMDKKPVVKTLSQDFALVLMQLDLTKAHVARENGERFVVVPTEKGNNYYVTDSACTQLRRIEKSSRRKPVVRVTMSHYSNGIPDSILIKHLNFKFNISLQRVEKK